MLQALEIRGADALTFLQGQLISNIRSITGARASLTALCNHKGRVISSGWLHQDGDDGFLWWLWPDMMTITQEHLQKYVLFSKVTLSAAESTAYVHQHDKGLTLDLLGLSISSNEQDALAPATFWSTCAQHRVALITAPVSAAFTPHMLAYDQHNIICLTKGCFVGQESIARTHHLGRPKRTLKRIQTDQGVHAAAHTTLVNQEGRTVGTTVTPLDGEGQAQALAVVSTAHEGDTRFEDGATRVQLLP